MNMFGQLDIGVAGPMFFLTLIMIPIFGLLIWKILGMMIEKDIDLITGIVAIFAIVMLFGLSIWAPHPAIPIVVILTVVSCAVAYPFALDMLDKFLSRQVDVEQLDKAHYALSQNPSNPVPRFEIARLLYEMGLKGSAILLAENTLAGLSTTMDPSRNASFRDMFKVEESKAKYWRKTLTDPHAYDPIPCPRCQALNPPGQIACQKCEGPFLLDILRHNTRTSSIVGRLVLSLALVAITIGVGAVIGLTLGGIYQVLAFLVMMGLVGFILWRLFADLH
ncbi:MAG: hypothetical protein JST40_08590 [Armatimonadetes bacterium]|nr:hypothetical protein [Armatimonadota bacterium]